MAVEDWAGTTGEMAGKRCAVNGATIYRVGAGLLFEDGVDLIKEAAKAVDWVCFRGGVVRDTTIDDGY